MHITDRCLRVRFQDFLKDYRAFAAPIFALGLVALTSDRFLSSTARLFIHVTDIAIISVLLFVTDRQSARFFCVFYFRLLSGNIAVALASCCRNDFDIWTNALHR